MLAERLLMERDRFRLSLEWVNRQAASWRRCATVAWAVPAILSLACATRVMSSGPLPRDGGADVTITISNERSRAMRFYVRAGSVDLPLGTVPALATRTFLVPSGFTNGASEFQIEARERGAEVGLLTERFTLGPGRVVTVSLSRARSPSVTVRPRPVSQLELRFRDSIRGPGRNLDGSCV